MTLTPLHDILKDLEESIKHRVTAHSAEASGTWPNLCQRPDSTTTLSVYCDCSVIAGRFYLGVYIVGLHTCRLFGSIVDTKNSQSIPFSERSKRLSLQSSACNMQSSLLNTSQSSHLCVYGRGPYSAISDMRHPTNVLTSIDSDSAVVSTHQGAFRSIS
jgi:hypothetical protein